MNEWMDGWLFSIFKCLSECLLLRELKRSGGGRGIGVVEVMIGEERRYIYIYIFKDMDGSPLQERR